MITEIQSYHGVPTLFINGQPQYANAYLSYLDEHARYSDFADAGIHRYSVPVYLAGRGINTYSGIGPFREGLLDDPEGISFAPLERDLRKIIEADPQACIFPRIMFDMPEWWDTLYPDELNLLSDGRTLRQSFCSKQWREDAGEALSQLVEFIEQSKYREHIIGYQLSAGVTEEWYYHGSPLADHSLPAQQAFARWKTDQKSRSSASDSAAVGYAHFSAETVRDESSVFLHPQHDQAEIEFRLFLSWAVSDAILYFTRHVKKLTEDHLIVGVFYGYSMELTDPRSGHHHLYPILRDPSVDFLCSPNSYIDGRQAGFDWPFMSVTDSIKLHGKLLWMECDTRTFLTRPLREARPAIVPEGMYEGGVWQGPSTRELSSALLIKNFARCLTTGVGQWWFDMWGGWFADDLLMKNMAAFERIGQESLQHPNRESTAEIAVFVDEKGNSLIRSDQELQTSWTYRQRLGLGLIGAPYDIYDISDLDAVEGRQYKLGLFLNITHANVELHESVKRLTNQGMSCCWTYAPGVGGDIGTMVMEERISDLVGIKVRELELPVAQPLQVVVEGVAFGSTDIRYGQEPLQYGTEQPLSPVFVVDDPAAIALGFIVGQENICGLAMKKNAKTTTFYSAAPNLPAPLLRDIAGIAGVHLYVHTDDVVYANEHYLCIHAASEGLKTIHLKQDCRVQDVFTNEVVADGVHQFTVELRLHETRLFRLL